MRKPFLPLCFHHGFQLCLIELDDLLLLAMDPTRENHEEKLPGLQDETHGQPVGGVIAKQFTISLSRARVNIV